MREPIHQGETLREDLDALGMSATLGHTVLQLGLVDSGDSHQVFL